MAEIDLKKAGEIVSKLETKTEPKMYNVEQISALLQSGMAQTVTEARIILESLGYQSPSQVIRKETAQPIPSQTIDIQKTGVGKYQISYQTTETVSQQQQEDLISLSKKNPFQEVKPVTAEDIKTVIDVAQHFAKKGIPTTFYTYEEIMKGSYQGIPTHAIVTDKPIGFIVQPISNVVENYPKSIEIKHPNVQVVIPQAVKEYAIAYSTASPIDKAMSHLIVDFFSRAKGAIEGKSQTQVTHEYMAGAFQQAIEEGGKLSPASAAIKGLSAAPTTMLAAFSAGYGLTALSSLGGSAAAASSIIGKGFIASSVAFSAPQVIKWAKEREWTNVAAFGLTTTVHAGLGYLGSKFAQYQITTYNYAKLGEKVLTASGYDVKEFTFKEKVEAGKVYYQALKEFFIQRPELYSNLAQTLKMHPELVAGYRTKILSSDVLKIGEKEFLGVHKGLIEVNERFLKLPIEEFGPKIQIYRFGGKTYFIPEGGYIKAELYPSVLKNVYYFSSKSIAFSINEKTSSFISGGKIVGSSKWLKNFEMEVGSVGLTKELLASENIKFGVYASKSLGTLKAESYISKDFGFYSAKKILTLPEGKIKILPNIDLKVESGTVYSIKQFGLTGWRASQPSISFGTQTIWEDISKNIFYSKSGALKTSFISLEKSLGGTLTKQIASSISSQVNIPKMQILQIPKIQVKPAIFAMPAIKTDLKLNIKLGEKTVSQEEQNLKVKIKTIEKNITKERVENITIPKQILSTVQFQAQMQRQKQMQPQQKQMQQQIQKLALKTPPTLASKISFFTSQFSFKFPKDTPKPPELITKIDFSSRKGIFSLSKPKISLLPKKFSISKSSRPLPTADLPHIEKSFALFGKATFSRGKESEKMFANIAKRFGVFARFPTLELMKKR